MDWTQKSNLLIFSAFLTEQFNFFGKAIAYLQSYSAGRQDVFIKSILKLKQ
jgi:hypothetical protein